MTEAVIKVKRAGSLDVSKSFLTFFFKIFFKIFLI